MLYFKVTKYCIVIVPDRCTCQCNELQTQLTMVVKVVKHRDKDLYQNYSYISHGCRDKWQ